MIRNFIYIKYFFYLPSPLKHISGGKLFCRSILDADLSCRRRSGSGGPCRDCVDTAGSPNCRLCSFFLSKINKKRAWSFPVYISRRSKRKCINKIIKHVYACICSVVLLLSIFNNMQMILLCSNFFCSCSLKQFKLFGYQQLRIFICSNVLNYNYSCSLKWLISK